MLFLIDYQAGSCLGKSFYDAIVNMYYDVHIDSGSIVEVLSCTLKSFVPRIVSWKAVVTSDLA